MRDQVILRCESCKRENYITSRNKKKQLERLVTRKYCPHERKYQIHKEIK